MGSIETVSTNSVGRPSRARKTKSNDSSKSDGIVSEKEELVILKENSKKPARKPRNMKVLSTQATVNSENLTNTNSISDEVVVKEHSKINDADFLIENLPS